MQTPDIVRVTFRRNQHPIESKIGAINLFRFVNMPLRQEQRAQRMPRRMHPRPWLRIVERIVVGNRLAQMFKGDVVVAAMIFHFTVKHFRGNAKDGARLVVHYQAIGRDVIDRVIELGALVFGCVMLTQCRRHHTTRVAHHGRRDAIELVILGQRLIDDLPPLTKAHQNMRLH